MVNLVGGGEMIIENTTFEPIYTTLLNLRADYGSTWRGHVLLKDCKIVLNEEIDKKTQLFLVGEYWTNHYFGYTCYMPNLTVDNLEVVTRDIPIHGVNYINRGNAGEMSVWVEKGCCDAVTSEGAENVNPLVAPDFIRVINNKAGHTYDIVDAPIFKNTEITGIERIIPADAE